MEHEDSQGNRGRIGAGDVQWMTAGSGVIHSELPSEEIRRNGGRMHGFQLWVNLPAKDKFTPPRYQSIEGGDATLEGTVTATKLKAFLQRWSTLPIQRRAHRAMEIAGAATFERGHLSLAERLVTTGDYVTKGMKVAIVVRVNPLRVQLTVPEQS